MDAEIRTNNRKIPYGWVQEPRQVDAGVPMGGGRGPNG